MAADRAGDMGIPLAELTNETMAILNKSMPANWSHSNPIDIAGDATPERYRDAIMAVTQDANVDSTLVMLSPQAMTDPLAVAQAIIEVSPTSLTVR
jgi:acetyltransferase